MKRESSKALVRATPTAGGVLLPAVIADAGEQAGRRFVEFFTANIRNPNTRAAYARAVGDFFAWLEEHGVTLERVEPFIVAAYVERLQSEKSAPTVKQALAAIRMLFDWLVVGQVLPMNPASSVRGPKHVVKKGKTPVLTAAVSRQLLDSIDVATISGLRDRALIGLMVFSFARVSATIGMNVEDYFQQGKRLCVRLHEKRGKRHDVPAHHSAEGYMDAYLKAAGAVESKSPLFRSIDKMGKLTLARLTRNDALWMVKR